MSDMLWRLSTVRLGCDISRFAAESLTIPTGATAIIGPSGAGKTSLLNLLVGFESPDSGSIERFATSRTTNQLPLFWAPAEGAFWPHLNTQDHLEAVRPSTMTPSELSESLRLFDLWEVRNAWPFQLSTGQKSRLAVLRGMIAQPDILVLDEPLSGVDADRARKCWELVRADQQRRSSHLVFATHDPLTVMRQAEHVLCLSQGRVVWSGGKHELYDQPPTRHVAEFLGPANWFEPDEARHWLRKTTTMPVCLRPERITVQADPHGPFRVTATRFLGNHEEVDVEDAIRGLRTVLHRPATPSLQAGTAVSLRVLLALLALFLPWVFSGCDRATEGARALNVKPISHRPLPPEGIMLPAPRGMTFSPENELYVLDNAGRILVYNLAGEVLRQWWMPEFSVGKPERACVLKDGRIAIADTHYHRVIFFTKTGEIQSMLGEKGYEPGQFIYTVAVTQDDDGNLYVAEYGGHDRVQKFTIDGKYLLEFGSVGTDPGQFQRPSGMFWHKDVIYIADAINNRIQKFSEDGKFLGVLADAASASLHYPYDIALSPDETIYTVEYGAGRVSRIGLDGQLLGQYGKEGRRLGEFWTPWGIAVSSTGRIAVADTGNRRMVELEIPN